MSSIVSGMSVSRVSGRKKKGIAAVSVINPMAMLGNVLSTMASRSTMNGATAAPILDVASRKQKAALRVDVGKTSGE